MTKDELRKEFVDCWFTGKLNGEKYLGEQGMTADISMEKVFNWAWDQREQAKKEERKKLTKIFEGMKEEWSEEGRFENGVDMWGEEYVRHAKMDWEARNLLLTRVVNIINSLTKTEKL